MTAEASPPRRELRSQPSEPVRPLALSEFGRGLIVGLLLAALLVGLMAARRTQDPTAIIGAIMRSGVPIDPRVARLPASVRTNVLCTALNVVMEARGEPDAGQIAVAWVTRTRSEQRDLSPCDAVFEYSGAAQFSWTTYTQRRIVQTATANGETLLEAQDYAYRVLIESADDPTHGANHFFAQRSMKPPIWARRAIPGSKTVIGGDTFLRLPVTRAPWVASDALR